MHRPRTIEKEPGLLNAEHLGPYPSTHDSNLACCERERLCDDLSNYKSVKAPTGKALSVTLHPASGYKEVRLEICGHLGGWCPSDYVKRASLGVLGAMWAIFPSISRDLTSRATSVSATPANCDYDSVDSSRP